jgi:hypothetical protein
MPHDIEKVRSIRKPTDSPDVTHFHPMEIYFVAEFMDQVWKQRVGRQISCFLVVQYHWLFAAKLRDQAGS